MLLDVKDLRVTFRVDGGKVLRAVDGVSFGVAQGESVGLVGESGCGKTTIGNALVGLTPVAAGSIMFNGVEVTRLRGAALRNYRQQVQMVFQDPFGSLNPRMTIGNAIAEVLEVHKLSKTRDQRHERVAQLLRDVGLAPEYARRYPHEFSGGQRQRVGIARALALQPSLIVADEPVSALDVSIQAQILKLLQGLRENLGFSCLFIAHDLAVVRYICDRALVMYLGKIVESAPCDELFAHPAHPYTEALLSAAPDVDKGLAARKSGGTRIVLQGDIPSATELIPGCPFHPRCHRARERCRTIVPERKVVGPGHESVCHFAEQLL